MYYLHTTSHIWRLFCEWILHIYHQLQSSCPLMNILQVLCKWCFFPSEPCNDKQPVDDETKLSNVGTVCYLPHSFTLYVADTVQLCKYFFFHTDLLFIRVNPSGMTLSRPILRNHWPRKMNKAKKKIKSYLTLDLGVVNPSCGTKQG